MFRLCLIASLALLALPAAAQTTPPPKPKALTQLFVSPMGEPFRAANGEAYPSEAWFKEADTNGDGAVDKAEFLADAQRFFKTLDTDGDGVLEEAEITTYETRIVPEVQIGTNAPDRTAAIDPYADYRSADGSPPEVHRDSMSRIADERQADAQKAANRLAARRGAGIFGYIDQPEPVRAADTNIDFRVSLREWMAAAAKRFDQLDVKRDGKLMMANLPKTPFQLMLEGRR